LTVPNMIQEAGAYSFQIT